MSREVGRVAALYRYPVKSMAEESLAVADVTWHGVSGDRRWAFIQPGHLASNFPWLTVRELPVMNQYHPSFVDPDRPEVSQTLVRTPAGDVVDVTDPRLVAELGDGVTLIRQNRGVFDAQPLSLLSTSSLVSLAKLVGTELDPRRFRPNLLVETFDDGFPEDAWVGRTLSVGTMTMRGDQRDSRCVMINIDPLTTAKNRDVLRAVAGERQNCFGLYGSVVVQGRVEVGDLVRLEDEDPAGP
jgi:uncharacterized protein YcbX